MFYRSLENEDHASAEGVHEHFIPLSTWPFCQCQQANATNRVPLRTLRLGIDNGDLTGTKYELPIAHCNKHLNSISTIPIWNRVAGGAQWR